MSTARVPLRLTGFVTVLAVCVFGQVSRATAVPGDVIRISVASDGTEGNGVSHSPSISGDGRYVAFESSASNLVPGDTNGHPDVFVRDRALGATTRISVSSVGEQGNDASNDPAISSSGRYVAFSSYATNLVVDDTNGAIDVFVHDLLTGSTTRVSVSSSGQEGDSNSFDPDISADGRFIAFFSGAVNLDPTITTVDANTYVHDQVTGTTTGVARAYDGGSLNGASFQPALSADGRFVVFASDSDRIVQGDDNLRSDIFVHDRVTGSTVRVSVSSEGMQAAYPGSSFNPSISGDGRYVTFESEATNLVPGDTNGQQDVFLRDLSMGTTTRVSVSSTGEQANLGSTMSTISSSGRYIAFSSDATNLVPRDTNEFCDIFGFTFNCTDVFVHDQFAGTTDRVSLAFNRMEGKGWSLGPSLSSDGREVAFTSEAPNLVPRDRNGVPDVFVRLLRTAP